MLIIIIKGISLKIISESTNEFLKIISEIHQFIKESITIEPTIDWSQFVPEIISTFLGFGLAILGEKLYDSYRDQTERKRLIMAFKNEFKNIKETLDEVDATPSARWLKPIKTPVWDSVISVYKISLIDNLEWFPKLCNLYDDISDYNGWQLLRTNHLYSNNASKLPKEIDAAIAKTKSDILNKMSDLQSQMK